MTARTPAADRIRRRRTRTIPSGRELSLTLVEVTAEDFLRLTVAGKRQYPYIELCWTARLVVHQTARLVVHQVATVAGPIGRKDNRLGVETKEWLILSRRAKSSFVDIESTVACRRKRYGPAIRRPYGHVVERLRGGERDSTTPAPELRVSRARSGRNRG
jgi:hypothetical protein